MNKYIYILFALTLAFSGCTEVISPENGNIIDEGFVLTINNSPLTKATANDGTDYERELRTLDIFFYPKGETGSPCVFYHHENLKANTYGQAVVPIYVVEDAIRKIFPTENTCEIFVIANLPDSVIPDGVTFNADADNVHTRLDSLSKYVLEMTGREAKGLIPQYDQLDKPFVMAGLAVGQKDSKKNASATVSLRRAASKVTLSVAIPDYIMIKDKQNIEVAMLPQCEDDQKNVTLKAAFHNGTYRGYIYKDADKSADDYLFSTEKKSFKYVKTLEPIKYKYDQTRDSIPSRRVYTCEVPFYTYSRMWEKGDADAAYMTFEMPWGYDKGDGTGVVYDTYYYQILINGPGRSFKPNNWYDMNVNIGVIGSSIENIPIVMDHLMFYILDWTDQDAEVDHPEEEVNLDMYKYLIVNEPLIELENVSNGNITFNASHKIAWDVTSAYYINNREEVNVSIENDITRENFTNQRTGILTYYYDIPSSIYSPVYVELDIWLDFDDDKVLDNDEKEYVQHVSIIQYPMMYVERDKSCLRSIYVNGARASYTSTSFSTTSISGYPLGNTNGVQNFDGDNESTNHSMYIINVSSFDSGDKFQAPYVENGYFKGVDTGNYSGGKHSEPTQPSTTDYGYIIGDPRTRTVDNGLGGGNNVENAWSNGRALYDLNGDEAANNYQRNLKYYYPTESEGEAFRIVAPRFRIVSFNNASGKSCTHHSAAMRCASLQEDGFPAGRWRLPTVAEIQYIIMLQEAKAVKDIFTSDGSYYATASYADAGHTKRIAVAVRNGKMSWNSLNANISVRCVYDEWYWGANREAIVNTGTAENVTDTEGNVNHTNKYLFTWGDRPISWE